MKLLNDFYSIVDEASCDGTYNCKVKMNPQHGLYKVHFPGNPVTPGVCLVQMATEILERKYNKKFLLSEAVNIKFRKTVVPEDEPTFVFNKVVFEDDLLKTSVTIEDNENQFVKMSLIYKVSD
ncbi:MAG: 3-hydroxyacyl-ACP dehydratase [Prevotella sp.]|nr:3-hydroxyacyl-ACP dehydratase [Prevotella sp.]